MIVSHNELDGKIRIVKIATDISRLPKPYSIKNRERRTDRMECGNENSRKTNHTVARVREERAAPGKEKGQTRDKSSRNYFKACLNHSQKVNIISIIGHLCLVNKKYFTKLLTTNEIKS